MIILYSFFRFINSTVLINFLKNTELYSFIYIMKKTLYFIIGLILIFSCKKNEVEKSDNIPLVFVHGYLGSGDSYEWIAKRFIANGYDKNRIYTFDWNTLGGNNQNTLPLEVFIGEILKQTGAEKVNLVGHSLGGGLSYNYCSKEKNQDKVAHLILIAPFIEEEKTIPFNTIPTFQIWSDMDYVVPNIDSINGASNLVISGVDHNEIAACEQSFIAIYKFIFGKNPDILVPIKESNITLSGKLVSFVENIVLPTAKLEIYEVDKNTGIRLNQNPVYLQSVSNGSWGPFAAKTDTYYEFVVSSKEKGVRPIHYFREPFNNSDKFVYLRTFPSSNSLVSLPLQSIPSNDKQCIAIFFSLSKALWFERDHLQIDDLNFDQEKFIGKTNHALAFFLYDGNRNDTSDLRPIPLLPTSQTLLTQDVFLPTQPIKPIKFNYNDRIINVRNIPSKEGLVVALYE